MDNVNATLKKQFTESVISLILKLLILFKGLLPDVFIRTVFSHLTKIELVCRNKESAQVSVCKYKYGSKGALCISIDFDLQIGIEKLGLLKEGVAEIIRIAEKYGIPMSWGICGNLARDQPEILRQIVGSTIYHDLGCHTFDHVDFSDAKCTESLATNEILKSVGVLENVRRPVTFIFPWNRVNYLPLLKDNGFVTYRGNNIAMLSYPIKVNGLWDIHKTYYLTEKAAQEVRLILNLVDFAISYGCVLHFWAHPWNLAINGDAQKFTEKVLEPMLDYAKQKKDSNTLWICTMQELANYCEARENCNLKFIESSKFKIVLSVHCKINDPRFDFPPTLTLRVRIPRNWRNPKVFVDDVELEHGTSCFVAKENFRRYLFLTITFEKPFRSIRLTQPHGG